MNNKKKTAEKLNSDPFAGLPLWSRWSRLRKGLLVGTGLVLLGALYGALLYTYVTLQPHPCQACRSLECLSFAENMCNQWDLLG